MLCWFVYIANLHKNSITKGFLYIMNLAVTAEKTKTELSMACFLRYIFPNQGGWRKLSSAPYTCLFRNFPPISFPRFCHIFHVTLKQNTTGRFYGLEEGEAGYLLAFFLMDMRPFFFLANSVHQLCLIRLGFHHIAWATVNSAAMNICMHVFVWVSVFNLKSYT